MNDATEYVHDHIVNYEPTYIALMDCVNHNMHPNTLKTVVRHSCTAMGLQYEDLRDVDYAAMIQWERENS